jgi:hypothetical protein
MAGRQLDRASLSWQIRVMPASGGPRERARAIALVVIIVIVIVGLVLSSFQSI